MSIRVIRAIVAKDLRESSRNRYWVLATFLALVFMTAVFWLLPARRPEWTVTVGLCPRPLAEAAAELLSLARRGRFGEQEAAMARGVEIVPFESEERLRVALERECRRRLRSPLKRLAFDFILSLVRYCFLFRENHRSEGIRILVAIRRMVRELGGRLVRRGVIDDTDDVFLLRGGELKAACMGRADFDVRRTVAERRAELERNSAVTTHPVVVGRYEPEDFVESVVDAGTGEFAGVGSSAGVARGRARVILRKGTDQVLSGEILVAPYTDPGWTPYFVNAAGIVIDLGGMLSHGSVIAREYGIPAVVNVASASKIIRTGQLIEVDGDRGLVRILEEARD